MGALAYSQRGRAARLHPTSSSLLVLLLIAMMWLLLSAPGVDARAGGESPGEEMPGVVEVNEENYYDIVGNDKYVLLEFYAEWCGFCKELATVYRHIGGLLMYDQALSDRVIIAKINGPESRKLRRRYGVKGYPTVVLIPPYKHTGIPYEDDRNLEAFMGFLRYHIPVTQPDL